MMILLAESNANVNVLCASSALKSASSASRAICAVAELLVFCRCNTAPAKFLRKLVHNNNNNDNNTLVFPLL